MSRSQLRFHAGYEQGTSAHGYSSVDARMLVRLGRTGISIFHVQAEDGYLGIDFLAIKLNSFDQHELGTSVVTCWVQHATKGESRDLESIHAYPPATQNGYSGYQQGFMTCGYFGSSEHHQKEGKIRI